MKREELRIGLFGYGCVGQGLHDVLQSSGFNAEIVRICVKDRNKPRRLPMDIFTFDRDDILNDPTINMVVELTSDPEEAYRIVTTAIRNRKHVVTAGKTMVAAHLPELISLQEEYRRIPVVRSLGLCQYTRYTQSRGIL